jgi:hypothetical protein
MKADELLNPMNGNQLINKLLCFMELWVSLRSCQYPNYITMISEMERILKETVQDLVLFWPRCTRENHENLQIVGVKAEFPIKQLQNLNVQRYR